MSSDQKSPIIANLLNLVSSDISKSKGKGMSRSSALAQNKCASCGADAKPSSFKDNASRREYALTAWCQKCQDAFFG